MTDPKALIATHPEGEFPGTQNQPPETSTSLDTFAGKIQVKWSPEAAVSSLGLMPFFIEFLKTSGLFEAWVQDCPLEYTSPNAPHKRDVLGTILLSVLAGHWRYAHISAIRGDGVNPELLGMSKVASEDSVRRALAAMKEQESEAWLKKHLKASYEPLLEEPWALDMDTTVKPLYGHQEDAKVGYNPQKPGRPSHAYHSYFLANLRLVLDVGCRLAIRPPRRLRNRSSTRHKFLGTRADEILPILSPDGRWLAYCSDATGTYEVYLKPFPEGGDTIEVSVHGGCQPGWAPDGRELYYVEKSALMAVPVRWVRGKIILGRPAPLFHSDNLVPEATDDHMYDVAPDGSRFVLVEHTEPAQNKPAIHIIQNWASATTSSATP